MVPPCLYSLMSELRKRLVSLQGTPQLCRTSFGCNRVIPFAMKVMGLRLGASSSFLGTLTPRLYVLRSKRALTSSPVLADVPAMRFTMLR